MSAVDYAVSAAPQRLLTRREAATYLAISQRKLDQLVANGEIVRVKIDSAVRFDRPDLDDFKASRKSS